MLYQTWVKLISIYLFFVLNKIRFAILIPNELFETTNKYVRNDLGTQLRIVPPWAKFRLSNGNHCGIISRQFRQLLVGSARLTEIKGIIMMKYDKIAMKMTPAMARWFP